MDPDDDAVSFEELGMKNPLEVDYEPDFDDPDVVQAIWLNADDPEELE